MEIIPMRLYLNKKAGMGEQEDDDTVNVVHHHVHHHHHGGSDTGHHAVAEVMQHVNEHPHSWSQYPTSREGVLHIVKMEIGELMEAISTNSEEHVHNELVDLAAACIYALKLK